jgi:hypothetical protein
MRYPLILAFMIVLDAILIILFIMFNYMFNNPVNGSITLLSDMANKTIIDPTFLAQVQSGFSLQNEFFGFGMTILIIMTVIIGVVGATDKDKPGE